MVHRLLLRLEQTSIPVQRMQNRLTALLLYGQLDLPADVRPGDGVPLFVGFSYLLEEGLSRQLLPR